MSAPSASFPPPPGDDRSRETGSHLLVAEEVAQLLAVPVSWVRQATRSGALPHIRLGRYVRYERDAIRTWVTDQRTRRIAVR
jgi:excisionase family DNA binding protein